MSLASTLNPEWYISIILKYYYYSVDFLLFNIASRLFVTLLLVSKIPGIGTVGSIWISFAGVFMLQ